MSSGAAVVVGASRGIGLALAQRLRGKGWKVFATCRRPASKLEDAAKDDEDFVVVRDVDVSDPACKSVLERALQGESKVDLLVVNAGIGMKDWSNNSVLDVDPDEAVRMFRTNCLGSILVTQALLDKLADGSKVLLVSSRVGSMADNGSGGMWEYRMSKAALNMVGVNLSLELGPKGCVVSLIHPGWVKTDMTGDNAPTSVEECVDGFMARIESLGGDANGKFIHAGTGEELPW